MFYLFLLCVLSCVFTQSCFGGPTACADLTETECPDQSEADGTCSGTMTDCTQFTQSTCPSGTHCFWMTTPMCSGMADTCDVINTDSTCTAQEGCTWKAAGSGECSGTRTCSAMGENDCNAAGGCSWTQVGQCNGGSYSCYDFSTFRCGTVKASTNCQVNGQQCAGIPKYTCSDLTIKNDCDVAEVEGTGCSWSTGSYSCKGTPTDCDAYSTNSTCVSQPGCSFGTIATDSCEGTATQCFGIMVEGNCNTQSGCAWTTGGCVSLMGNDCTVITVQNQCELTGCTWGGPVCDGTAEDCTLYSVQNDCENQGGCEWGTAPVCSPVCENGYCVWDETVTPAVPMCECEEGYGGDTCACDETVCEENEECGVGDICVCKEGFQANTEDVCELVGGAATIAFSLYVMVILALIIGA